MEDRFSPTSTAEKVATVKDLLGNESATIKLHEFLIQEVREFLSSTSEDHFPIKQSYSPDQFKERFGQYENAVLHLASIVACVAYWSRPNQRYLLQKVLSRSTDRLVSERSVSWQALPWYPIVVLFYSSGIAAVEGQRYDSLSDIFYTSLPKSDHWEKESRLAESVSRKIKGLEEIFKLIPEHEHQYVPVSEYLFKVLQPKLDDIFFISKNYEKVFDEFEVLYSLVAIDLWKQNQGWPYIPLGRFAWKHSNIENPPYGKVIREANIAGEAWQPIRSGLFGGSIQRFTAAAEHLSKMISKRDWG
ncbi:MAG: caspase family protein, partial [Pyrinomonadaceae bacterium]